MKDSCKITDEMLPDEKIYDLADFFKVFGDSSRLRVLWLLHRNELCVTHIAEQLGMSTPSISHQLKILRQSHLVRIRRVGKNTYYSLADDHVQKILELGLEHVEE